MELKYLPISKIHPDPKNAKDHNTEAIISAIQRFGFRVPILIEESTNRIAAGHGRHEAVLQMEARKDDLPDGIRRGEGGAWLVPVALGKDFPSDEEAMAFRIADNRLTEIGGWIQPRLEENLKKLAAKGKEMLRGVGYDSKKIAQLMSDAKAQVSDQDFSKKWFVLIECQDEAEQLDWLERLIEEGVKCRAIIS